MASHRRRDNDCLVFTATTPHFFKIILDDTLRDGKLGIPRRFVRKYGKGLPNPVLLKVPSGAEWQVELTKCDGDVWLQNGWQEFAEYYSLAHGHFLVFGYEDNSHFSVVIFDTSASEVGYPYTITHREESSDGDGEFQEPKMDETKDNISVEILDDILPCPKRREKSRLPCPRPHKLMRTNSTNKTERTSKKQTFVSTHSKGEELEDLKRNIDSQCSAQELGVGPSAKVAGGGMSTVQKCPKSKVLGRISPLTLKEKSRALQIASDFKSENPFFVVAMQPSYIHTGCTLNIPFKFAKRNFNEKHREVILWVSDGRTWAVKYSVGENNAQPKASFNSKWMVFARENNLKVGDVCIFELINGFENSLHVVIVPVDKDLNCSLSQGSKVKGFKLTTKRCMRRGGNLTLKVRDKAKARQIAKDFKSENPFFVVTMQPSYVTGRVLSIPTSFSKKYFSEVDTDVILRASDGSNWSVKGRFKAYGSERSSSQLFCGWKAFAQTYDLKVGDVCVFELVSITKMCLKVVVFSSG